MQLAYKVEVFDRNLQFRSYALIQPPEIFFDYLTLEKTEIRTARELISIEKGDIAHVTDSAGHVVYQGIVTDFEHQRGAMTISLSPLLSLFDLSVNYDRTVLQNGALEDFIAGIITDTFISNPDILQNIPGLTVQTTTTTTDTALNIKSNVHEFYDIIIKAFTMYGVVVTVVFNPQAKKLMVSIGKHTAAAIIIEAGLPNVLEKTIVIGDRYGKTNKITLINKNNESERVTYYLHSNGKIDTIDDDRVLPVFPSVEYVESEDFAVDAADRAREALATQQNDNLIELTYHLADGLIFPEILAIGTPVTIIDQQATYSSILTGYEQSPLTIKLIFGNIRIELTKKLILERRGSK